MDFDKDSLREKDIKDFMISATESFVRRKDMINVTLDISSSEMELVGKLLKLLRK